MAKKAPSKAVEKAVSQAVPVVAPVETTEKKRVRLFSSEDYVREYLQEVKDNGTWQSLCERTGMVLTNVRQCITNLRSEYRAMMLEKAQSSPDFMKQLAKVKTDVEIWADRKAEEKFPYFSERSERNTRKAAMKRSWEQEELSL